MIRFGDSFEDVDLKRGLQELNPGLTFPSGTAVDGSRDHPQIDTKQGVYFNGKHICSMGRGRVPEFHVWSIRKNTLTGIEYRSNIMFCGWRHTFAELVNANVPGVTWDTLCAKFNVSYKRPTGEPEGTEADSAQVQLAEGVAI